MLGACSFQPENAAQATATIDAGPAAITLHEVEFVHSRGSTVFARGRVAEMTYVRETGDTVATSASMRFPREGEPGTAVDITAPRASGNPLEARVTGEGGVRVANQQGDRGDTERATYLGKRGEAWGDRPVELFGPGFELQSPGFRWHQASDMLDLGPSQVVTK